MSTETTTLDSVVSVYDQLGGAGSVETAVELFYQRVLGDSLLQPYFVSVDMETLKSQQIDFLTQALGGPADLPRAYDEASP